MSGANNNNLVIETTDLRKTYGKIDAVKDLNLAIKKGEIFGFLGPNGAGKSTTIRMLCGILEPSGGVGHVAGYDIAKEPEDVKRVIGYMSQAFGLYQDLTVKENIEFYARIYIGRKKAKESTERVIKEMGLEKYRNHLAAELSGGWKQRLALATAISHNPTVMFLDEPTAGIDPVSRRIIWDILYDLSASGMTLFVTTHYMEEAERCNTIAFIMNGKLVAQGHPSMVKTDLMKDELLSFKPSDLHHAFNALCNIEGLKDVNIYGDEIHVVAPSADDAIPLISEILEKQKISTTKMRRVDPSIEDVFVALSKEL